MALITVPQPANAADVIARVIPRLASLGGGAAGVIRVDALHRMALSVPHPVFVVDAVDIMGDGQLAKAYQVSWRYLLMDDQVAIGAIELACDSDGSNLRFSGFNVGPFVRETQLAINRAEQIDQVQRGAYELRALRLPSVYIMALWLRDTLGANDLILTMLPPGSANPFTVLPIGGAGPRDGFTSKAFFETIRPLARSVVTTNNAPIS